MMCATSLTHTPVTHIQSHTHTYTHTLSLTHTRTHTLSLTHTYTHNHAHTHAHTHTHTQDPLHPERLKVTYMTHEKQLEDCHTNIQYEPIASHELDASSAFHEPSEVSYDINYAKHPI